MREIIYGYNSLFTEKCKYYFTHQKNKNAVYFDRTLYDYNFNIRSASRARTRNCFRSAVPIPLLVPGNLTVNGLTARPLI